jgi:hypothetical protein
VQGWDGASSCMVCVAVGVAGGRMVPKVAAQLGSAEGSKRECV